MSQILLFCVGALLGVEIRIACLGDMNQIHSYQ